MADVTLGAGSFPPSTSVSAYTNLGAAASATATSGADGSVTFTGLAENREYVASDGTSQKRFSTRDTGQAPTKIRHISFAVDLANITAGTTAAVNLTAPAGTVEVNDRVAFRRADSLEHGLVVQSVGAIVTADTIPIRVSNLTAADINAASHTFGFTIFKP